MPYSLFDLGRAIPASLSPVVYRLLTRKLWAFLLPVAGFWCWRWLAAKADRKLEAESSKLPPWPWPPLVGMTASVVVA